MTGKEIIEQVLLLGARESFDFEFQYEAIYGAINRAIDEVNKLFPVTKTVQLLNYPIRPAVYHKGITVHKGGEDTVFDASDIKSLAFAVSGTGKAILSYDYETEDIEGNKVTETEECSFGWEDLTKLEVQKKLIGSRCLCQYFKNGYKGKIRLKFTGDYNYLIKDISLYDELDGDVEEDVDIFSPWVAYDMAAANYAGGAFLDFASIPIRFNDVSLNAPRDYRIEGSIIYLPADKPGAYELSYYKRPEHFDLDNDGIEADIDPRLHVLVALRAAYYLYAIIDEEAAENANTEYQKALSLVMTTMPKLKSPKQFRDRRGW